MNDLHGLDAIVHLSALSNDPMGDIKPDLTYDINYHASVRLAEMAKEAGVQRFLYSSSCSIYGAAGEVAVTEDYTLMPLTPYAESKARTEEGLSKIATSDFSPVFMRNATAYGISPKLSTDLVVNNLVCWAFTTSQVRLLSDGMAWRPLVHIADISHAFHVALEAPQDVVHNQAFNIGMQGENYLVKELADIVSEEVPGCEVVYGEGSTADNRSYQVSFDKFAKACPEFSPTWDVRRGVRQLYGEFMKAGLSLADFQGQRYVRLNYLNYLMESKLVRDDLRWEGEHGNISDETRRGL